jgi:hypothetical protein
MTSRRQLFQRLALLRPSNLRGSWLLETASTKRRKSMKVRHDLASKNANQRSAPWLRLIIRETNVLRAVYFDSSDAESEEVATTPTEARRCTQNLPLPDQDTKFGRCRPMGVGHKRASRKLARLAMVSRLVGSDQSTGIGAKKVVAVLAFSNQRYWLG